MKKRHKTKEYLIVGISFLLCITSLNKANAQNFNLINKIVESDRDSNIQFGSSLAISGDYAIVGAPAAKGDSNNTNFILGAGAAYIYTKSAKGAWVEAQKLVASDRDSINEFFGVVAILGNYAIVGAPRDGGDTIGSNGANYMVSAGSAYVFERDIQTGIWVEKQKIVASDRDSGDFFGSSIAIDGNYALIGAKYKDTLGLNYVGAAYVFEKNSFGKWIEVAKLIENVPHEDNYFGSSVAIAGDYIAIGVFGDDFANTIDSMNFAGSVSLFKRNTNPVSWDFQQKVMASDRDTSALFGKSVTMEGDFLIVGASGEDFADTIGGDEKPLAGAAYVFKRNTSGHYNQQQKLVALDRGVINAFGSSVAISGDVLLIGARGNVFNELGADSIKWGGAAYFYKKNTVGSWIQTQKIVSKDREWKGYFGYNVALSDSNAIVGAWGESFNVHNQDSLTNAGAAYIFGICDVNTTIDASTLLITNGIRANDTLAAAYQWIDCAKGNAAIPGATGYSYSPKRDGNYAVIVQLNACADTSACVKVLGTSINEVSANGVANIYPNPANEELFIDLGEIKGTNVSLIDLTGKEVYSRSIADEKQLNISLRDFDNGIYFVVIATENNTFTHKVVVLHE